MDSNFSVKITADISELQGRLKSVEVVVEKFKKSMDDAGNATKAMEQNANRGRLVAFAFGQVLRDAGFFAQDFRLGILAISNNIPILIDQLVLLSGVSKGVGSVFSLLGSLLTAGLTIWAYSGDAVKKNKESIEDWRKSLDDAIEVQLKGKQSALEESTSLDILYKAATNVANSNKTRTEAAKELQDLYPRIFGNLDTESIKLGQAKNAYDALKKSIVETAFVEAAKNKIVENATRVLDNDTRIREARINRIKAETELLKEQQKTRGVSEDVFAATKGAVGASGINVNQDLEKSFARQAQLKLQIAGYDKTIYNSTTDSNILNGENSQLLEGIGKYTDAYVNSLRDGNGELDRAKRQTLDWRLYAKDVGSEFRNIFSAIKGKDVKQFELFPSNLLSVQQEQLKNFVLEMIRIEQQIDDIFTNGIALTIGNAMMAIGDAFATGGNVGKAFGKAILGSLASVLSQFGDMLIAASLAGLTFSTALANLFNPANWGVALAAGIALKIAAGALGGFARNPSGGNNMAMPPTGQSGPNFLALPTAFQNGTMSMNSNNPMTLQTRISGNDLAILVNRADKNRNGYY
jgi:hypothetical protein